MISSSFRFSCVTMLLIAAGVVGVGVLVLTYLVFEPIVMARTVQQPEEHKATLPPYDARQFHDLPVQHRGRQKPFQSAAIESVREICGASKFEGKDPVALVLAWILSEGRSLGPGFSDWESYAFILCNHQGLRKVVYAHLTDADRINLQDGQAWRAVDRDAHTPRLRLCAKRCDYLLNQRHEIRRLAV